MSSMLIDMGWSPSACERPRPMTAMSNESIPAMPSPCTAPRFVMPPPLRLVVRMRLRGAGSDGSESRLLRRDWSDATDDGVNVSVG